MNAVNLKKLFRENGTKSHPYPRKITYQNKEIFLLDKFPVENEDTLIFSIESTNSFYPQGFCVGVRNGYIKVNGKPSSRKRKYTNNLFWEGSEVLDVEHIEIQVFTESDHVIIRNLWEINTYEEVLTGADAERRTGRTPEAKPIACFVGSDQWTVGKGNGAAMYSEDISNGKRYFCNDGEEDDDFDDIIFTVRRKLKEE